MNVWNRVTACVFLLAVVSGCGRSDGSRESPADAAAPFDLLVHGGTLIDGTGAPGRTADLLVRDGRIVFVGAVNPETLDVRDSFDASGLVVTPGFIDAHAHGDPIGDPAFHNFLAMGVTTIVLGQDGGSPGAAEFAEHLAATDAARPGVNVAYLIGHNTVRLESGVGHGEPGTEGMRRMSVLVAKGLEAGAYGLSTGLEYDPGSKAGSEELAAIAAPVAQVGAVISSHLRSENADQVDEALRELIEQGRRSGARVHVSHIKIVLESDTLAAQSLLRTMAGARDAGIDITADIYPYTASFTGLSILFPDWARPPNDYDSAVRSRRVDLADHLHQRVESRNGPAATLLGTGQWAGRTLAEVADETGDPYEEILIELGPDGASAAYFVINDEVMHRLLRDPGVVGSSDGSPTMLHPRGYGSFARLIRQHVVLEPLFPLEEAIRKLSGATAAIYRLDDTAVSRPPRGQLQKDWAADILVFDPTEVRDAADFEQPHLLAGGMRRVWVNGALAWRESEQIPRIGHGSVLRADW